MRVRNRKILRSERLPLRYRPVPKRVNVETLTCRRCGHTWVPRKDVVYECPKCKSARWDVPKSQK